MAARRYTGTRTRTADTPFSNWGLDGRRPASLPVCECVCVCAALEHTATNSPTPRSLSLGLDRCVLAGVRPRRPHERTQVNAVNAERPQTLQNMFDVFGTSADG